MEEIFKQTNFPFWNVRCWKNFYSKYTSRIEGMVSLFNRHVRWHMDCEGARDWFEKFSAERGFPEDLNRAICQALQSKKSLT